MFLFLLESAARSVVLAIVVWTGLLLFRIRSPRDQFLAWAALLLSAACMPLLIVAVQSLMAPPSLAWIPASSPSFFLRPLPSAISNATASSLDFVGLVSMFYAVIVGVFLVRLAAGLRRSRRLVKKRFPYVSPGLKVVMCGSAGTLPFRQRSGPPFFFLLIILNGTPLRGRRSWHMNLHMFAAGIFTRT